MIDELSDHLVDEMWAEFHRHLARGCTMEQASQQAYAYVERKVANALDIADERFQQQVADDALS